MSRTAPARPGPLAGAALAALLAAACASTPAAPPQAVQQRLRAGEEAMAGGAFARAEELLSGLATERPDEPAGREARYLLGVLLLDPRNPAWDPARAADAFDGYVTEGSRPRQGEAEALQALAHRLAELGARAGTDTPTAATAQGAPAAEAGPPAPQTDGLARLDEEIGRLKKSVADKDAEIARLQQELERIRRTLAPRP